MFEVLGYENTQKLLRIISISYPQISFNRLWCAAVRKKNTEMRSIAVEGNRVEQCICVTIPFGFTTVGSGFISRMMMHGYTESALWRTFMKEK